jgi:hypothetical protein
MVGEAVFVVGAWMRSVLLLAGSAEPAADDIVLSWDAPPQCPNTGLAFLDEVLSC